MATVQCVGLANYFHLYYTILKFLSDLDSAVNSF